MVEISGWDLFFWLSKIFEKNLRVIWVLTRPFKIATFLQRKFLGQNSPQQKADGLPFLSIPWGHALKVVNGVVAAGLQDAAQASGLVTDECLGC